MENAIRDYRGYTEHWFRNDRSFTYAFNEYERDEENGRCYLLVASTSMHDPNMDGALVKKRISKTSYEEALRLCKKVYEERED